MKGLGYYILNTQGEPVHEPNLDVWCEWFKKNDNQRRVARETFGASDVSTVFLGLDHQWGEGKPLLWETMVFGGLLSEEQERCSGTRADALAMHEAMVKRVKEHQEKGKE